MRVSCARRRIQAHLTGRKKRLAAGPLHAHRAALDRHARQRAFAHHAERRTEHAHLDVAALDLEQTRRVVTDVEARRAGAQLRAHQHRGLLQDLDAAAAAQQAHARAVGQREVTLSGVDRRAREHRCAGRKLSQFWAPKPQPCCHRDGRRHGRRAASERAATPHCKQALRQPLGLLAGPQRRDRQRTLTQAAINIHGRLRLGVV